MTKGTFQYLWEQAIVKAANHVINEIPSESRSKYEVKLDTSDEKCLKAY